MFRCVKRENNFLTKQHHVVLLYNDENYVRMCFLYLFLFIRFLFQVFFLILFHLIEEISGQVIEILLQKRNMSSVMYMYTITTSNLILLLLIETRKFFVA